MMRPSPAAVLEAWANFYVIVGSSAGGLTGLQFVVLTLIAQASGLRAGGDALAAYGSPNVVHFCAALLVAALLSSPWHSFTPIGLLVAACGAAGVGYSIVVLNRARRQTGYDPVLEDWLWHTVFPLAAYAALVAGGIALALRATGWLFAIAGAELLLLFIGIHNAWDTVTYITLEQGARQRKKEEGLRLSGAPGAARDPTGPSP